MKLILINITSTLNKNLMPHLGLGYVASYVVYQKLADVDIIDLSFYENPFEMLIRELDKIKNKGLKDEEVVFGISMNTHNRYSVKKASEIIKSKFKNSLVFSGGPHITLEPMDTLKNCRAIDIGIIGEGELTVCELLKELKNNSLKGNIDNILGIVYRDGENIIVNPRRSRIKDLDKIPFPDRDALNVKKFPPLHIPGTNPKEVKGTNMIGSRGCPYKCVFCSVADQWGRQTTFRSPENIIEEIELVYNKYGYNGIYFFDDTFTLSKKRTVDFCNLMIDKNLNEKISWFCEIRANTVDYILLKLMKEAGCTGVAMGVESSNQWLLDNVIKKGITIEQVKNVIKWCNDLNIHLKCFFSIGHPGETFNMALETLKFRDGIRCSEKAISFMKIYPGTPLYNIAKEREIIPKDFSWFKHYDNLEWQSYDINVGKYTVPVFRDKMDEKDYAKLMAYLNKNNSLIKIIGENINRINSRNFIRYLVLGSIFIKNKILFKLNITK